MPDPIVAVPPVVPVIPANDTTPFANGVNTSEGKLAIVASALSVLAAVLPGLASMLSDLAVRFPAWTWIGGIITVVGVIGSILTAIGYGSQRAKLKEVALQSNAVSAGVAAGVAATRDPR